MKKKLLLIVAIFFLLESRAQDQQDNLEKYWAYRERLREKFIVISENVEHFGVNIPASNRNNSTNTVEWGDANNGMSHYLSVLATELWLLKNNNQDYTQTLTELYYAMLAMERMDLYSEYWWRYRENIGYNYGGYWIRGYTDAGYDVNGMHLREDVTQGFWNNHQSHFQMANFRSVFNKSGIYYMEEISQDNMYHTMEGLALVDRLIEEESVAGIPVTFTNNYIPDYLSSKGIKTGSTINFSEWAEDLIKRYIHWMQVGYMRWIIPGPFGTVLASLTNHWLLVNPVTADPVKEGSGTDLDLGLFYNAGVIAAGNELVGQNLREQGAFIKSNSESRDLFEYLFALGPQRIHMTIEFPEPFDFEIDLFDIVFDDYKVRTLATYGDILGWPDTFNKLRMSRDNYMPLDYEHMPMIYCALWDPLGQLLVPETQVYNTDRNLIENLLNSAPVNGPSSFGPHDWSHDSRLVWPERLGTITEDKEFSGLDYMLLHNLYYISFRREDFLNYELEDDWLDNAIYDVGTFRFGALEASNVIPANGNASYKACQYIRLNPGFKATSGCSFQAKIEPRSNQYIGALYKVPDESGGRIKPSEANTSADSDLSGIAFHQAPIINPMLTIPVQANNEKIESLQPKFAVYPNPTRGKVSIEFPELPLGESSLEVLDINGKTLMSVKKLDVNHEIDLSGFDAGIYVLKIQCNDRVFVQKITRLAN